MGGRRLPRKEALRFAAVLWTAVLLVLLAGCRNGGSGDAGASPEPVVLASPSSAVPTPSPTPDLLATPPASHVDARAWLQRALGPSGFDPPCPQRFQQAGVACTEGDVDGDGLKDLAYLLPVTLPGTLLPHPSAVFLRRGGTQKLEEFAGDLTADASPMGIAAFSLVDRTGDARGDLTYLENRCGASGCKTTVVIQTWDGTAWRDAGPADSGIANVDSVSWTGSGASSALRIHGGKLPASAPAEAGPSRAATTTLQLVGSRYTATKVEHDSAEYLYQAFLDADAIFDRDKEASIAAFESVLTREALKDWKAKSDQKDRRPALKGFALFRIVLAKAVLQDDAASITAAIDRVILQSALPDFEPLFVNVAMEFRRGYNESGGLIGGCAAVNLYLTRPAAGADTRAYVEQLFNYGYANPAGSAWLTKICPF